MNTGARTSRPTITTLPARRAHATRTTTTASATTTTAERVGAIMPRRKRPTSALLMTIGIIGIVAGTLGLMCGFCGTAGAAFVLSVAKGGPSSEYLRYLDREAPLAR